MSSGKVSQDPVDTVMRDLDTSSGTAANLRGHGLRDTDITRRLDALQTSGELSGVDTRGSEPAFAVSRFRGLSIRVGSTGSDEVTILIERDPVAEAIMRFQRKLRK